jgi:hypothetical protein
MNDLQVSLVINALANIEDQLEALNHDPLSFRDEFAKAAITGILAGKWGQMPQYKPEEAFADFAYKMADAMLKRREQE